MIEDHADVRAELGPDLEHAARRHAVLRPVEVGAVVDPGVVDLLQATQAEDLVAVAVGEDAVVPAHEAVQAPVGSDQLRAGAVREVVRVAEHDLRPAGLQVPGGEALDRPIRPHRHEHGRLHRAVGGEQHPAARVAATGDLDEGAHGAAVDGTGRLEDAAGMGKRVGHDPACWG